MILLGTHIYDSTMADKNAIVPNALQLSLSAQDAIEGLPTNLINTFELYYDDELIITFNSFPFIYYFSKDFWASRLDVNKGNYYCNLEKFEIKWVDNQEKIVVNGESAKRLISWDNSLILSHNSDGLEIPNTATQSQEDYTLTMRASSLSISSDNPAHSDWTPKIIDYHYWRNHSENYYIDIPIAPLSFPLNVNDFTFNLNLNLKIKDNDFEILSLTGLKLIEQNNGEFFFEERTGASYKISYNRATTDSRITATHILISEFDFSQRIDNGENLIDLLDGRLYLTITPVGSPTVKGIENFKYLTCFNLIYREAPFFFNTDLTSIEWTLDKNDSAYPYLDLTDYTLTYNAGTTIKVNIPKSLELCGRPLNNFYLYESLNGKDYSKTRVITSENNNEIVFTLLPKTTTEQIYFAFGAATFDDDGLLTTSTADLLKLAKPLTIGRIVKPQVQITSCTKTDDNSGIYVNLAVDDYGGDNKSDSNLITYCEYSEQFWGVRDLQPVCIIELFKSLKPQFNGSPVKTITLTGPYNEKDWSSVEFIELTNEEKMSTLYLKAKVMFTYGCQNNIDIIAGETPVFTFLGLEKLPTLSYLKNQVGVNSPNLRTGDLLNITSVDQKSLINLFNGAIQYSSINVASRNLNEFIINCGSWDDAEFGFSNFKTQIAQGRTLSTIAVSNITEAIWSSVPLYLVTRSKKLGTNETKKTALTYIGNLQKPFSEKANILKNITTVYFYTNVGVEQFNDINQQKLTVQE